MQWLKWTFFAPGAFGRKVLLCLVHLLLMKLSLAFLGHFIDYNRNRVILWTVGLIDNLSLDTPPWLSFWRPKELSKHISPLINYNSIIANKAQNAII